MKVVNTQTSIKVLLFLFLSAFCLIHSTSVLAGYDDTQAINTVLSEAKSKAYSQTTLSTLKYLEKKARGEKRIAIAKMTGTISFTALQLAIPIFGWAVLGLTENISGGSITWTRDFNLARKGFKIEISKIKKAKNILREVVLQNQRLENGKNLKMTDHFKTFLSTWKDSGLSDEELVKTIAAYNKKGMDYLYKNEQDSQHNFNLFQGDYYELLQNQITKRLTPSEASTYN